MKAFCILTCLFVMSCTSELRFNAEARPPAPFTGTVAIGNLRNNSRVQSGFVIGTASDTNGLTAVQISLDGGAFQSATGTTNWSYKLPTGGNTWRHGSVHSIAARAQNLSGSYSTPVTIQVSKDNNRDINGDGYQDLAVGAYYYNSTQGRVYAFYSSGTNGITNTSAATAAVIIDGQASSHFGRTVSVGDVNGDGYADLAVCALNTGYSYIFHSRGTNGIIATSVADADTAIQDTQPGVFCLKLCDFTGDGYDDVAVGNLGKHSVSLIASAGSSGIASGSTATIGHTIQLYQGIHTIDFGDVNGDGYPDLATSSLANNVLIFHNQGGTFTVTNYLQASTMILGNAGFGSSLSFGDMDNDGYADLAVARYQMRTVHLYRSTGSSGIVASNLNNADITISSAAASGLGVLFCDYNNDGYADLVTGSHYSGGGTWVFIADGSGMITATNVIQADVYIPDLGGRLFADADVNGDGVMDLVAADPANTANQGVVGVFHTDPVAGITASGIGDANTLIAGEVSSTWFGGDLGNL